MRCSMSEWAKMKDLEILVLTPNTTKRATPQSGPISGHPQKTTPKFQTLTTLLIYVQMASNQEQLIQQALNDLDIGAEKSIRRVAAKYRVPKTTVAYRRRGRNPRTQANRRTQRLSLEEERTLI